MTSFLSFLFFFFKEKEISSPTDFPARSASYWTLLVPSAFVLGAVWAFDSQTDSVQDFQKAICLENRRKSPRGNGPLVNGRI